MDSVKRSARSASESTAHWWVAQTRKLAGLRMGSLGRRFLGLSVFITATVIGAPAYGDPIFVKPNVPDFYQHQKAGDDANKPMLDFTKAFQSPPPGGPAPRPPDPPGVPSYETTPNWWERGFGWCCVTAFVDSFYFLEKTYGFTGFFTRTAAEAAYAAAHGGTFPTWQQEMIYATEDMARDLGFTNMIACPSCGPEGPNYPPTVGEPAILNHVRKLDDGRGLVTYTEYNVTDGFGTASPTVKRKDADLRAGSFRPETDVTTKLFDLYRTELCRSEDVTIRIAFPSGTVNDNWWNLHVMTGAGIQGCEDTLKEGTIYVADPDNRNKIVDGAYTDEIVRDRYPYGDTVPLPVPPAAGTDAERTRNYEALTLDANGCITAAPRVPTYVGACIFNITAISPVPEPSTWLLLGTGIAGVLALDWRRRRRV